MKYLKVQLVRTTRTDVMCIACGMFRSEFEVCNGGEAEVGVHRKCIDRVKVRRFKREKPA
jgi:hypothetical protein